MALPSSQKIEQLKPDWLARNRVSTFRDDPPRKKVLSHQQKELGEEEYLVREGFLNSLSDHQIKKLHSQWIGSLLQIRTAQRGTQLLNKKENETVKRQN